jgi:hypothetical protein
MLSLQLLVALKGAVATAFLTCRGPVPVLFNVTVLAALVVATTWPKKNTVVGETAAPGAVPEPVRLTVCAVPALPELSVTVSSSFAGPVTVGVKVTETAQVDAAGSWLGQLLVSANGATAEMFDKSSGLPPKLEIVTV